MKVRVLSDLHLDVNASRFIELKDKDVFTVLCGDTAGDPIIAKKWIKKNVHHGLFIAGNHLVYNNRGIISDLREEMADGFGIDDPVTYLDCLQDSGVFHKKVEDVHFIGTTLYTDFRLHNEYIDRRIPRSDDPEIVRIYNRKIAHSRMNDYKWGRVIDEDGNKRFLTPEDCQEFFEQSFSKIKKKVKQIEHEEENSKIFILTHHCPSPQCIDNIYLDSDVNAAYASDLESFILDHKSIKCWACGHVHKQKTFKVGDCLIVMNPRGYCTWCEDIEFSKDLTVDTDTWTVEKPALTAKQIAKNKRRLAMSLAFMSGF